MPAGFVVDHIDNNRENNQISNLQLLDQRGNVLKGKVGQRKRKPVKVKKLRSMEYYLERFSKWFILYEKAKQEGNAKQAHKCRSYIAKDRAILKQNYNIDADEKIGR